MRKKIIAGNWKMNTDRSSAVALTRAVVEGVSAMNLSDGVDVVLCPPFVLVPIVGDEIRNTPIKLGAQNMHNLASGAYTGEVSGGMLRSVGCTHVIVGHSERRLMFAESDLDICYKANAAVSAGVNPIICVGETEVEREMNRTEEVIRRQVRTAFDGIFEFNVRGCVVAYEPIWAIGTNNPATPEQAQEVHAYIRGLLRELYNEAVSNDIPIIYGGSIKDSNAAAIFSQPDVDGGLVGGASLDAKSFLGIIRGVAGS